MLCRLSTVRPAAVLSESAHPAKAQTDGFGLLVKFFTHLDRVVRTPEAKRCLLLTKIKQAVTKVVSKKGHLAADLRTESFVSKRSLLLSGLALSSSLVWRHPAAARDAQTEEEVRAAVRSAFEKTAGKAKAPVLLRLAFHDSGTYSRKAQTGGANASVRLELKRPENTGLNRGWKVVDQTMQALEGSAAGGRVSYADLIALGGAYAVSVTGGPSIQVPLGRKDASQPDAQGLLPVETASADELLQCFADKGFTAAEFVALSGAHTLGNKGFGDPVTFDNAYFKALQLRPWEDKANSMAAMIGLPSDHVLSDSKACQPAIQRYADSQAAFFEDFAAAYTKLTVLGTNLAEAAVENS